MIETRQTKTFGKWLRSLRDARAKAKILVRIERAALGNFGDHKRFDGLIELRVDYGPGYRVYATQHGAALIILLCGGDKSSQARDIAAAAALLVEIG